MTDHGRNRNASDLFPLCSAITNLRCTRLSTSARFCSWPGADRAGMAAPRIGRQRPLRVAESCGSAPSVACIGCPGKRPRFRNGMGEPVSAQSSRMTRASAGRRSGACAVRFCPCCSGCSFRVERRSLKGDLCHGRHRESSRRPHARRLLLDHCFHWWRRWSVCRGSACRHRRYFRSGPSRPGRVAPGISIRGPTYVDVGDTATNHPQLVFNDGTTYIVRDYWRVDDQLHFITVEDGGTKSVEHTVPFSDLDVPRTSDADLARGFRFVVRDKPIEQWLRDHLPRRQSS
jgi:hypothetical protein